MFQHNVGDYEEAEYYMVRYDQLGYSVAVQGDDLIIGSDQELEASE